MLRNEVREREDEDINELRQCLCCLGLRFDLYGTIFWGYLVWCEWFDVMVG